MKNTDSSNVEADFLNSGKKKAVKRGVNFGRVREKLPFHDFTCPGCVFADIRPNGEVEVGKVTVLK